MTDESKRAEAAEALREAMSGPPTSENRLQEIVKSGDMKKLLSVALEARFGDEVCDCDEPILEGLDLMCGRCLHENQGQIDKRTKAINSPHEFQEARGEGARRLGMCGFCSGWTDDPRHLDPAPKRNQ